MQELFEGQTVTGQGITPSLLLIHASPSGSVSDASTPMLPNPAFRMFVFPRISTRDQVRIPGYWVTFDLYERNEPALDHESVVLDRVDGKTE